MYVLYAKWTILLVNSQVHIQISCELPRHFVNIYDS